MEITRRIGQFLIIPAWLYTKYPEDVVLGPDEVPLVIGMGETFGNGGHATTRMCLLMLQAQLKPGDSVLDIGCGSGILGIAAAKLGARSILAIDKDPAAQAATFANLALNTLESPLEFRLGTLETALPQTTNVPVQTFNLITANLFSGIILDLLSSGLANYLAPGGRLILSGFLPRQSPAIETALPGTGFRLLEKEVSDDDWVALTAERIA